MGAHMSNRNWVEPAQEPFLNQLRKRNTPVTIYLTNGIREEGTIASFDANTILFKGKGEPGPGKVLYKHLVATIQRRPAKARVAGDRHSRTTAVSREFRDGPNTLHLRRAQYSKDATGAGPDLANGGET